jgi:serine/threonine protein kinase
VALSVCHQFNFVIVPSPDEHSFTRDSETLAIKSFRRTARFRTHENILQEFSTLQCIQEYLDMTDNKSLQSHFPVVYDCCYDDHSIYLVMQFVQGVELFKAIHLHGSFTEQRTAKVLQDVLKALSVCESLSLVHRDISLENIIYNEASDLATLVDFGVAVKLGFPLNGESNIHCAKPAFLPPESHHGVAAVNDHTGDVWACGVLTLSLLLGFQPFEETTDEDERFEFFISDNWPLLLKSWRVSLSHSALHFVSNMLCIDKNRRASINSLLTHPFVTGSHLCQDGKEEDRLNQWDRNWSKTVGEKTAEVSSFWSVNTKYGSDHELDDSNNHQCSDIAVDEYDYVSIDPSFSASFLL